MLCEYLPHEFPLWGTIKGYCIALHCIALHCIALHCIALHCIALHCIALHCIALHCIVPFGWPLSVCIHECRVCHCVTCYSRQPVETKNSGSTAPAAPSTPLPATPLPSTPLPSTPLPSTPVPVASCGPSTPSQGPSTPTVKLETDMKPVLTVKEEGRPPVVDKDRADDQKVSVYL